MSKKSNEKDAVKAKAAISPKKSTSNTAEHGNDDSAVTQAELVPAEPPHTTTEEQDRLEVLRLLKQMDIQAPPPSAALAKAKPSDAHKFWDTQPVPKLHENPHDHGPIDELKKVSDVRQTPYAMPPGFSWSDIDLNDPVQQEEVYTLLNENYVEDDDNMFRFDYSVDFLKWALKPPEYKQDWHVGVRNQKNNKLMAFISGVPAHIRPYETTIPMAEINFLCVHKKLRTKRLAPVLIKEITRRVNLTDTWQAVYTAGVVLPKPVASCRYYHRSLNPKKLIEVGFSRLQPRMTMNRTIKLFRLPDEPSVPGFRPMEPKDVPQVHKLVTEYLARFKLAPVFSQEEIAHWMLPRRGVLDAFVVENPDTKVVTDVCSFYHLPSTVIGNEKHSTLRAAYSFYNVATSVPLVDLMNACMIMAKKLDFDVFNALNIMDNDEFLAPLKFGMGDGHLQYYLYNWRCPSMEPKDLGLVLC